MKQIFIYLMNNIIIIILVVILCLISVAFLTLFERKILSYMHYRKGPNKVSFLGLLQPFSDALKLLTKEYFYPLDSNFFLYIMSPFLMLSLTLFMWILYPFQTNLFNWNLNSLFFLSIMSLGSWTMMISGWSSGSMYSMIGAVRSAAQMISYEVTFALSFMVPLMLIDSLNLMELTMYNKFMMLILLFWPSMTILFISMLAEVNRTPFDLSEGESELVSGFNVEYSGYLFVLIFLAEYSSIMIMMLLFSWMNFCLNFFNLFFYLMIITLTYFMIWIRATYPRIRYDTLMDLCWSTLLPYILLIYLMFIIFFKVPLWFMLNLFIKF